MADRIRGLQQKTPPAGAQTQAPPPGHPPTSRPLNPASLRARTAAAVAANKADIDGKIKERSPSARLAKLLLWVFLIHVGAIYLFTRGFLLSRSVLDSKSECKNTNIDESGGGSMLGADECWYPQQYKKAVVIVIDALRFE
jgi:phosphatidylinositol glycan class O